MTELSAVTDALETLGLARTDRLTLEELSDALETARKSNPHRRSELEAAHSVISRAIWAEHHRQVDAARRVATRETLLLPGSRSLTDAGEPSPSSTGDESGAQEMEDDGDGDEVDGTTTWSRTGIHSTHTEPITIETLRKAVGVVFTIGDIEVERNRTAYVAHLTQGNEERALVHEADLRAFLDNCNSWEHEFRTAAWDAESIIAFLEISDHDQNHWDSVVVDGFEFQPYLPTWESAEPWTLAEGWWEITGGDSPGNDSSGEHILVSFGGKYFHLDRHGGESQRDQLYAADDEQAIALFQEAISPANECSSE